MSERPREAGLGRGRSSTERQRQQRSQRFLWGALELGWCDSELDVSV